MMFSDKEKAFNHCWNSCICPSSVTPTGWFYDGWDAAQAEQGEVSKLQKDLEESNKAYNRVFEDSMALKAQLRDCQNERDTWKGRHLSLKSAIWDAYRVADLDTTTYG